MSDDICRQCGEACAFCNEDDGRFLGSDDIDAAEKAERDRIRADVEALSAAWVRGDNVEVSRLLVKLRDAC